MQARGTGPEPASRSYSTEAAIACLGLGDRLGRPDVEPLAVEARAEKLPKLGGVEEEGR